MRENTDQNNSKYGHFLSSDNLNERAKNHTMSNQLHLYFPLFLDQMYTYRSSSPMVFCKKGVLKNFEKFTGKHLCQSLFFNKVAGSLLPKSRNSYHRVIFILPCNIHITIYITPATPTK